MEFKELNIEEEIDVELIEEIILEEVGVDENPTSYKLVDVVLPHLEKGEEVTSMQYVIEGMIQDELTPRQVLKLLNSSNGYRGAHWNKVGNEVWLEDLKWGKKLYEQDRDSYMTVSTYEKIEDA